MAGAICKSKFYVNTSDWFPHLHRRGGRAHDPHPLTSDLRLMVPLGGVETVPYWSQARMKVPDWFEMSLTSEVLAALNVREDRLVEGARRGEEDPALHCASVGHHLVMAR